jgi:pimeloyl-ACP methyl ester carboxylesterase
MPYADSDGVRLYYEETGSGYPILFIHEYAGDYLSWEPQLRYFSRRYRCIAYNARGYPPSDVPESGDAYGQNRATDDAHNVLAHLGIARAHIVGLSMGGFATAHFGMRYGAEARSLVVGGCGYGSAPEDHATFGVWSHEIADQIDATGMADFGPGYFDTPARETLKRKVPREFDESLRRFREHSVIGAAMHMRHVQGERPSLWDFEDQLGALAMPVLIVNGDVDDACHKTGAYLKRTIPDSGHWMLPDTGHAINLEEPELFNQGLERFFAAAEVRSPA